MRVPSRLPSLIAVLALAGGSFGLSGVAQAQSAGDQQYQDPLAGETQTTAPSTSTPAPTAPDPATVPQLSPSTGSGSGSGTGSGTGTTPTVTTPTAPLPSALPNTGLDGRILAGIGFGMLLLGVGLRLRTARERF